MCVGKHVLPIGGGGTYPEKCRQTAREDALAWFASDDRLWPFSFLNICDVLDLDAHWLRARLAQKLGDDVRRRRESAGMRRGLMGTAA